MMTSFQLASGLISKLVVVLVVGISIWTYRSIRPPPAKICGSLSGHPVTAQRIKLRDGRHLAYKEHGVPKHKAQYKFVFVHGFDSCRLDATNIFASPEVAEELGIYMVSFDRSGYGESDPNPKRTVKCTALDVEELADQLGLGSKFYVIGFSTGGQVIWTCLKYIPHRLAGAVLLTPVVNYWWTGLPSNLSSEAYYKQLRQDQWTLRVAHYAPWLTYWWNTQTWFPSSSVAASSPDSLSTTDKEIMVDLSRKRDFSAQIRQQGEYESIHRDLIIAFGTWEFSPLDLKYSFSDDEVSVHLWQGDEDAMVPALLQRYIAKQLPWIQYHELPRAGHMFPIADGMGDSIFKALLLDQK